jgi:YesN/AraC family two-component response regulator
MIRIAVEARNFIYTNFKIDFIISISNVHKSFFGIPEAYQEALDAIEYELTMENCKIISYDEIKILNGDYYYSIETEHQLINFIKSGNFEESKKIVNEVFEKNFNKSTLSIDVIKCLMFDLICTMLKTKPEISSANDVEFFNEMDIVGRLLKCEKILEMKQQMIEILEQICTYIRQSKKGKKEQLMENLIQYIGNNYSDVNLSIANISDKFGLTPPYLAKLFKEYEGETLLDYICRIRMEEAKKILKKQESSIKDIASKVGYCNSNVFIRAFKKHTGVTPGIFRGL